MAQTIVYIVLYALFNVSGAAFIKWQLQGKTLATINDWLQLLWNVPFFFAFVLILLSALVMFKALSTNNFSLIIPLATGINFLLTVLVGYYFFHDRLTLLSLLGFLLIISGILLLSLNKTHA